MSNYLITLTPVDKFFFGGETTFIRSSKKNLEEMTSDEKKLKEFDKDFSSYIVKSNLFPQQTSLLGMLRFLILSSNKELFDNRKIRKDKHEEAANLIGEESFRLNEDLLQSFFQEKDEKKKEVLSEQAFSAMDFKSIEKLHPCFIQRSENGVQWQNLVIAPMDFVRKNKAKETDRVIVPFKKSFQEGRALLDVEKQKTPVIDGYEAKEGLQTFLTDGSGKNGWKISELFQKDVRIGIDRDFKGITKPDAYYKQIFYRFTDSYKHTENEHDDSAYKFHKLRFAFYAELAYDFTGNNDKTVSLGGDNSRFLLHAEKVEEIPEFILPADKNFENCEAKLILTTEALIEDEALNHCLFSINETVPFRFLLSTVKTKNYYTFLGPGAERLQRSNKKYNLYRRGSVFFFDSQNDLEKFKAAINNKKLFRQIGYNKYLIN